MTPSAISPKYPWSSVFQNSEAETVALNIAKILKRTGNTFRLLSREEYTTECKKDGVGQVLYGDPFASYKYEDVAKYLETAANAATFCKDWAKALIDAVPAT